MESLKSHLKIVFFFLKGLLLLLHRQTSCTYIFNKYTHIYYIENWRGKNRLRQSYWGKRTWYIYENKNEDYFLGHPRYIYIDIIIIIIYPSSLNVSRINTPFYIPITTYFLFQQTFRKVGTSHSGWCVFSYHLLTIHIRIFRTIRKSLGLMLRSLLYLLFSFILSFLSIRTYEDWRK